MTVTEKQIQEVEVHQTEARRLIEALKIAVPLSSEDDNVIGHWLRQAHDRRKDLIERKKLITTPQKQAMQAINDLFDPAIKAYEEVKDEAKKALQRGLEEKKTKNETIYKEAEEGSFANTDKLVPEEPPDTVIYMDRYEPELVNISLVPLGFVAVDWKKVRAHVRKYKDAVPIPGIKIVRKTKVRVK